MSLWWRPSNSGWPAAAAPASSPPLSAALRLLLRFPVTECRRSTQPKRQRRRPYRKTSALQVLQRLLPPRLASTLPPRATRPHVVGDIGVIRLDATSELRQSRFLPLVGQVVLERNPQLKTLAVESALSPEQAVGGGRDSHSLAEWQVVAGVPTLRATVLEHGRKFSVDLGSCFWNAKRANERGRLASEVLDYCRAVAKGFPRTSTPVLVCDLTAGVGALSIHIAAGAEAGTVPAVVHANDWNPVASAMTMHNRAQNHLTEQQLRVSSLSVAEFVRVLAVQPERWREAGAVLILDAPRPEGISNLLAALRPLLQTHNNLANAAGRVSPLRLVLYAMAPPQMLTPAAWEARLVHECTDCVEPSSAPVKVSSVVLVRSVGKGWELVCVCADWLGCNYS